MKILEDVTENCVSEPVEHDGPALLFVRGKFSRIASVAVLISDDPSEEFLEVATAAGPGVMPIPYRGRYFVQLRFTTDPQFGESCVSVSSNQSVVEVAL